MNIENINIREVEDLVKSKMNENGHAMISPSAANTWMTCPGSCVGLNEHRKVNPDNLASVEGTCAHFLLELCLLLEVSPIYLNSNKHNPTADMLIDAKSWCDRVCNNSSNEDKVIDAAFEFHRQIRELDFSNEMRHEINKTYDKVMEFVSEGWTMLPEVKVKLHEYLGHSQCDGTSDVIMYKDTDLIVIDLKYGENIEVSPEDNKQLKIYAAGAVSFLSGMNITIDSVTLVISQTRINDAVWKEWDTNYQELYHWIFDEVQPASHKALYAIAHEEEVPESWYEPSLSGCKWCHRRSTCGPRLAHTKSKTLAAFKEGLSEIENSLKPKPFNPDNISDEMLAKILDAEPFIKAWFKDAEKEALARVQKGKDISGRKMVLGRVNRKWKNNDSVIVKKFTDMGMSPNEIFITKIKSPAQIEKSAIDPEIKSKAMGLVKESRGNDVMALSTDSREAVTSKSKLQAAFATLVK